MTVPEYVAQQTERIAEGLAHFIATTAEDKLDWKPALEGSAPTRSVLEQVSECVQVNNLIAAVLRGEEVSFAVIWETIPFHNAQDAQDQLIASAQNLASAIRDLSEEDMTREFEHPRGKMLGVNIIQTPYRNMAYHAGQVNLYQILCGDADFHVPPKWR